MGMKLLIWDFDGTLGYRDGGMWSASLAEAVHDALPHANATPEEISPLLRSGFPWNAPDVPHAHITSGDAWWEMLYPACERALVGVGIPQAEAAPVARQIRPIYTRLANWRLYDDALPALLELGAAGWTHVLLSNHVPELSQILEHLGVTSYFQAIYNSAETGYEKPHPRAFQQVLEDFAQGAITCMVGDNPAADVRGAEAVGIPAILVRTAHPEATRFCQSLDQLPPVLWQLEQGNAHN